jgi:hypothetical protein
MKSLSKLVAIASGLTVLALAAFSVSPVLADSPGQIEGGNIFQIQNLTQKSSFANPATANACDELEYSVQLANVGYGNLSNVTVSVNLPTTSGTSNAATMTASGQTGGTPATSTITATATVNISSAQTVSYVNGSTQLLDEKGNLIENLPEGVTTQSGVNIGTLVGSAIEYVNFKAQVSCPAPAQPVYTCNQLSVTEPAAKQIQASVQYTAQNGATFKSVTYNFGDNSTPLTTTNTSTSYTYTNYGSYNVTATVAFNVNGASQTATSTNCAKAVSFTAPTTPTPPTLVNTGPGDVIGLFGLTTVAGTVAHRLFGRRLGHFFVK